MLQKLKEESIKREKQLTKLEAEVVAMQDTVPRWISVDDRLPPLDCKNVPSTSKVVLVFAKEEGVVEPYIDVAWYSEIYSGKIYVV